MAINIKNVATGEIFVVNNACKQDGKILAHWKSPAPKADGKFFASHPYFVYTEDFVNYVPKNINCRVVNLIDGYELINENQRTKKPQPAEPAAEPKPVPAAPAKNAGKTATEKRVEKAQSEATANKTTTAEAALIEALKKIRGGNIDADAIKQIVSDTLTEMLAAADSNKVKKLTAKVKSGDKKQYYCKDFDDMLQDVADGYNIYLVGAAGSGKSHTAEQIADALGLDFYCQTTIQFAHDVRGYGDAGGNYQETPFFKAFANGGLYFQDEYDRSLPEAAIVLNTALANGYYDFPIIGRVNAHPDFRFMAAGNTMMKGADEQYTSGQTLDASCTDRFGAIYTCEYNHEVELNAIAKGDTELVSFIEDVREAIKQAGIMHIVSYRATSYMVNRQSNKVATLQRCTFKSLEVDEIREIYGKLNNKENVWARATKKLF